MTDNYKLQVRCVGLENNAVFPLENTGRGKDLSPAFILFSKILPIGLYGIFRHRKLLPERFRKTTSISFYNLSPDSTKSMFMKSAEKHILQRGTVIGRFE